MVAAIVTDNFLTTTPWDRKTHFYDAMKIALTNAGFTTDIHEYDRADTAAILLRSNNVAYQANGSNSIKGIVKQVVLDASKAKGTVQFDFSTQKNSTFNAFSQNGSSVVSTDYTNQSTSLAIAAYWGGWDSANARRNLATTAGAAIGSWYGPQPLSTAEYTDSSTLSALFAGAFDSTLDPIWNITTGQRRSATPLGSTYTPGYSYYSSTWFGNFYGALNETNPLCRLPNPNAAVQFKAINHPEIRGIYILQQNRAPWFLGYIRPSQKPSWWDEDTFPYCFIPVTPYFNHFAGFSGSYFPIPSTSWFAWHELTYNLLTGRNTFTNKLDIQSSPTLRYPTDTAILGKFSADVVQIPADGISMFDKIVVTSGVEEYLVISGTRHNASNPYLGLRIV